MCKQTNISTHGRGDGNNIIGPNEGGAAGAGSAHFGKADRVEAACVQIRRRKGAHAANPGLR